MRLRDQVALTLPSLMLRLVLGVTFVWAGTGKLIGTYEITGDDAARLANMGVMPTPIVAAPVPPIKVDDLPANTPAPESRLPDPATDKTIPAQVTPPATDDAKSPAVTPAQTPIEKPAEKTAEEIKANAERVMENAVEKVNEKTGGVVPPPADPTSSQFELKSVQYNRATYAGSDFPEPMQTKRVYSIALMISRAADPGLTPDSQPIELLAPSKLASKPWPTTLAWTAAITELVCGVLLIFGLFTRLSALGTLSVMLVAMWMTQVGPAIIQQQDAILGFIPRIADPWSPAAYSVLLWQFALAGMSVAVMFLGSGAVGIDRLFFKPVHRDPYIHGDPKASKTNSAKSGPARSEFDRTPPNPTP